MEICGRKTYVISDIHNDAANFQKMLKVSGFSKEDLLIIDGDIFDRGDNPVDLYFEILKHEHVNSHLQSTGLRHIGCDFTIQSISDWIY